MKVFIGLLVLSGLVFFGGWTFMLTVGVAHNEWWPTIPPIGYWSAVQVFLVPTCGSAAAMFVVTVLQSLTGDN